MIYVTYSGDSFRIVPVATFCSLDFEPLLLSSYLAKRRCLLFLLFEITLIGYHEQPCLECSRRLFCRGSVDKAALRSEGWERSGSCSECQKSFGSLDELRRCLLFSVADSERCNFALGTCTCTGRGVAGSACIVLPGEKPISK
jgi:hypothetical protein